METAGKRKLGYTHYIDDGKSHADVVKDEPYPDIVVEKLDCVSHIKKTFWRSTAKITIDQQI